MSEESYGNVDVSEFDAGPTEKKDNTTLWIILAVVAVVILLCCCVFFISVYFIIQSAEYDQLFFDIYSLLPAI